MKLVTLLAHMLLLSGCATNLAEIRVAQPVHLAEHQSVAADAMAHCILRELELVPVFDHLFLLSSQSPDHSEFYVTAKESPMFGGQGVGFEFYVTTHQQSAIVELRQGSMYQWILDRHAWPIVNHCAISLIHSTAPPAAAVSPK